MNGARTCCHPIYSDMCSGTYANTEQSPIPLQLSPYAQDRQDRWVTRRCQTLLHQYEQSLATSCRPLQPPPRVHVLHGKFRTAEVLSIILSIIKCTLTSIELNCFPLYASANSAASDAFLNLMTTIERFGAESLKKVRKLLSELR